MRTTPFFLAVTLLVLCLPVKLSARRGPDVAEVKIDNFRFSPGTIEIRAGETVRWSNRDDVPHTIASKSFKSGALDTGESFSYRFEKAGTYDYYCSIHPHMTGKVVVS